MPLPPFDPNGVLPPTTGNPAVAGNMSPYRCASLEFGQRFGTTLRRRSILLGWLGLRSVLRQAGFQSAFQWIDGSFVEDIETTERRPPNDVDAVTFYWPPDPGFNNRVVTGHPELQSPAQLKTQFMTDHYLVDLSFHPVQVVDVTAYWYGLFSHRRDRVWKGLLRIELGSQIDDDALTSWLARQP